MTLKMNMMARKEDMQLNVAPKCQEPYTSNAQNFDFFRIGGKRKSSAIALAR
jgi:hypothetical protein